MVAWRLEGLGDIYSTRNEHVTGCENDPAIETDFCERVKSIKYKIGF